MKSDVMDIAVRLSKEELKALTRETKETLALDVRITAVKLRAFGAIDMWNLQKRARTAASMRSW